MTASSSVHERQWANYQSLRGVTEHAYTTYIMGTADCLIYVYMSHTVDNTLVTSFILMVKSFPESWDPCISYVKSWTLGKQA
jgi:hypothetical protein